MRRLLTGVALAAYCLLAHPAPAHANLLRGVAYLVGSVVEIPRSVLAGTLSGPPVIGTAAGAINGVFNSAVYLARGTYEVAATAVPVAKAVGPFLLPFLF